MKSKTENRVRETRKWEQQNVQRDMINGWTEEENNTSPLLIITLVWMCEIPHVTPSYFPPFVCTPALIVIRSLLFLDGFGIFPSEARAATTQMKRKINMLSLWHPPAGNRRLSRLNKSEQRKNERCWMRQTNTGWDRETDDGGKRAGNKNI